MERSLPKKIVNAILKRGLIGKEKLDELLKKDKKGVSGDIIKKIAESGLIPEKELLALMSQELDIPPLDLSRIEPDEEIIKIIPEKIAKRYNVMPVSVIGNNLTLAVCDPTDVFAIDDIKTITKCNVSMVLTTKTWLNDAYKVYAQGIEENVSAILEENEATEVSGMEVVGTEEVLESLDIMERSKTAPIVKVVSVMISEAIKKRASDIHIEPQEKSLRIRYRIDGELYNAFEMPKRNQKAIIARLKIMSNLDITETRVPQDGRFKVKIEGKEIDFRVSVLPATYGNKIVLRALDKRNLSIGLDALGFLPEPLNDFKKALAVPYGIILVTGPTGSGKSTTLYSILNSLNVPERNIVTVEDPVEYQLEGITQVATMPEIGLDFSSGLRSLLRQSPDIIMIGEIRDFETADVAIKAALTGHMVLSTLHTNDAVGAITRLENMGIEPFLVASSLIMTCAQRLLRKICSHCKVEANVPQEILKDLGNAFPEVRETKKFFVGKGCAKCNNTGYLGRLGTLETLLVDDNLREMINKHRTEEELREYLNNVGFRTLRQNAIIKLCKGLTTFEEIFRVT